MNEKYYLENPNKFSSAKLFCEEHSMAFDVRCSGCFSKFGNNDPDVTYIIGRKRFGGTEAREFSLTESTTVNRNLPLR
jgi:hypothetical protein